MVKGVKAISLDVEMIERLSNEKNASELIENLLIQYYRDRKFQEKTLEDKLQEVEELQSDIIRQREQERLKIQEEIKKLQEQEREMVKKQKEEIDKNINLIESRPELCKKLLEHYKQEPKIIDDGKLILDDVQAFRNSGLKVGVIQLQQYLKTKKYSKKALQDVNG